MLPYIYENIWLTNSGLTLEQIRSIDDYDFQVHLHIFMARDISNKEWQMRLAGADPKSSGKKKAPTKEEILYGKGFKKGGGAKRVQENKKFNPEIGDFV